MPMSEPRVKFVEFVKYCHKCVNKDKPESEDPCHDCLNHPVNLGSHKPVNFKPAE